MQQPSPGPANPLVSLAPALFVLLWSSGFVAAKLAIPYAEPFTFLFLRFGLVVVLALSFCLVVGTRWPSGPQQLDVVLAGIMMQGTYLGLVVLAIYHGMPAGVVALIVSLNPITTAVLARAILGEPITPVGWLGFLLGIVGAALVLWPQLDFAASGIKPETIAACLLALPAMSGGTIYQKKYGAGVEVGAAMLLQHVGATVFVGIMALLSESKPIVWAPMLLGTWIWQTVVVSIGAVALLLLMLREQGAARAASVFYLIPAASAALAWALLGESLAIVQIAGTVLVTLAVVLISRGTRARSYADQLR